MSIKAFRGGETSRRWSDDPTSEKIITGPNGLNFEFSMPSKGGGVTKVSLHISLESFEAVVAAMLQADEDAAIHALGSALATRKAPKSN